MRPSSSALVAVPKGPQNRTRAKLPRFYRDRVTRQNVLPQQLPLTGKSGNKEYYKGTGQAFVPGAGGSARTGPPGYWKPRSGIRGQAGETTTTYRLDDERVRIYVGPGMEVLDGGKHKLKPYVDATSLPPLRTLVGFRPPDSPYTLYPSRIPPAKRPWVPHPLQHFRDPANMRRDHPDASHHFIWDIYDRPRPLTIYQLPGKRPDGDGRLTDQDWAVPPFSPVSPSELDRKSWSRWYRSLEHSQRLAVIMKQRGKWWYGLQGVLARDMNSVPEDPEETEEERIERSQRERYAAQALMYESADEDAADGQPRPAMDMQEADEWDGSPIGRENEVSTGSRDGAGSAEEGQEGGESESRLKESEEEGDEPRVLSLGRRRRGRGRRSY